VEGFVQTITGYEDDDDQDDDDDEEFDGLGEDLEGSDSQANPPPPSSTPMDTSNTPGPGTTARSTLSGHRTVYLLEDPVDVEGHIDPSTVASEPLDLVLNKAMSEDELNSYLQSDMSYQVDNVVVNSVMDVVPEATNYPIADTSDVVVVSPIPTEPEVDIFMSEMDFSKILDSSAANSSVQKMYCSRLLDAMNQDSDDDVEAVESMTLSAQMIDQAKSCTVKRSLFPVSAHRNGSPVLSDPPPAQNPPKRQTKKTNWGPVPAIGQSKRNIGKGDVLERAKQYKMK
jgi:hypothetical protein